MKLTEAFPSNYIKAADLNGKQVPVTISKVSMEEIGTGNERKLVLNFQGKEKGMICNKTNAGRIAYLYGDETDNWIGKEIVLYGDLVDFQGKTVEAIRVRPPAKKTAGVELEDTF